ncbi:MAG TPA: histidine-type phosphatase [Rhizomicrobium sp.]
MRFLLSLVLALGVAVPATAAPVLEKVIVLQRHGVRSPTKPPADLAAYSPTPFAAWPVAPGELTPHGATALTRMGEALRAHYAAMLPRADCRDTGRLFVWADNADSRTRQSGDAMAAALAPGCKVAAQFTPAGSDDVLFHPGDAFCPVDADEGGKAIAARLPMLLAAERKRYDGARARLQSLLDPSLSQDACANDSSKKCAIAADRNEVRKGKLAGTLAEGSTLSENFLLEYAQGLPDARVKDTASLAAIMPLHHLYADLARRTPLIAAHGATLIARQIRDALSPVPAFQGRAPVPADARFVLLAGHDTNLSNLGGMLGLKWELPGEPDVTAPNTALAFELWQDGKARFVRIVIWYQTPDQLRTLSPIAAHPPHVALSLPGCGRSCSLDKALKALDAPLIQECLKPLP